MIWYVTRELFMLAALGFALRLTRDKILRGNLVSQIVYSPFLFAAEHIWGFKSPWYALTYCLFTVPILAFAGLITWRELEPHANRLKAVAIVAVLALAMAGLAFSDLGRPAVYFDYMTLTEAAIELLLGLLLGFCARRSVEVLLSFLLLSQSIFGFGYVIHYGGETWERFNDWMPWALLTCAALFLVARGIPEKKAA